ncbi:hypothetical protein ACU8KH_02752 [Lachancea thermotolerans]
MLLELLSSPLVLNTERSFTVRQLHMCLEATSSRHLPVKRRQVSTIIEGTASLESFAKINGVYNRRVKEFQFKDTIISSHLGLSRDTQQVGARLVIKLTSY